MNSGILSSVQWLRYKASPKLLRITSTSALKYMMKLTRSSNRFYIKPLLATRPPLVAAMTATRTMVEASVLLLLALVYERRNIWRWRLTFHLRRSTWPWLTKVRWHYNIGKNRRIAKKLVLSLNRNRPIVQKLVAFDLDRNKDKFCACLEVSKAMNDYEELKKLKKEAKEMPSVWLWAIRFEKIDPTAGGWQRREWPPTARPNIGVWYCERE